MFVLTFIRFFKDKQVAICWERAVRHVEQFDSYVFMQTD